MYGDKALEQLLKMDGWHTLLDIGAGDGDQAKIFWDAGKDVTTISLREPADIICDYTRFHVKLGNEYDAIWASHVLEHQKNVNQFLEKCFRDLKTGGILAVTVPPAKPEIVGGHLTIWNLGLLLYNLIVAGFDCKDAWYDVYGYNISVIVRKKQANLPKLQYDSGDINALAEFFPFPVSEGFNGNAPTITKDTLQDPEGAGR